MSCAAIARVRDRGVYYGDDRDGRTVYFAVTDDHRLLIPAIYPPASADRGEVINALLALLDAMSPRRATFTLRMPGIVS